MLYKNSLILWTSVTEKPFVHKVAFYAFKTNFIFHKDLVMNILKIINIRGIINIGGKSQSVYNFVKKYNPKIIKISAKKICSRASLSSTMLLQLLNKTVSTSEEWPKWSFSDFYTIARKGASTLLLCNYLAYCYHCYKTFGHFLSVSASWGRTINVSKNYHLTKGEEIRF